MNMSLRSWMHRVVPSTPREIVSSALRHVLGSRWKAIAFRHIDQTPLSAFSNSRPFEPELKLLPLFFSKPGIVFDVGANIGEYTYVLEKAVGPENTYAIEPVPQLISRLKGLFPKAHVLHMALSDEAGTLTLKIPIIQGGPIWTRSTLERFVEDGETGALFQDVPVLPLDQLCERLHISDVQLIKIDVEGHEGKVLSGASKILQACRPVLQVEMEQRHHTESITEMFSWIQGQGYSGFFFDPQTMSLRPVKDFSVGRDQDVQNLGGANYINNFLFLNERLAQSRIESVSQILSKSK